MGEAIKNSDECVSGEWGIKECKHCSDLISMQIARINELIREVLRESFDAKDFFINLTHRMLCELGDYSPFEIKVRIEPTDEHGDVKEKEISEQSLGDFKIRWFTEQLRNGEIEFENKGEDGYVTVSIEPKKLSSRRRIGHSRNFKVQDKKIPDSLDNHRIQTT